MKRLRRLVLACFLAPALVLQAQPAINSGAIGDSPLPLRNLQIEVRQVDDARGERERIDADGAVRLQPGASGLGVTLSAQAQNDQRSGQLQQRALVLNGRRATIRLGNLVPLQLLQSFQRQGRWITVPGTVWLPTDSGFDAVPRWDGGTQVALELQALQGRDAPASTAAVATTVVLPLNEWVTVAESEAAQDSQSGSLTGTARGSRRTRLQMQVRVTLR